MGNRSTCHRKRPVDVIASFVADRMRKCCCKLADFILLDRNLFEIPIAELYQTRVELTVLGGEVVYDRSSAR